MHSPDERFFILSILLLPFLILIPLLLFILSNSSPPLIQFQTAPPPSPSILVAEPKTENLTTTTKRQKHMTFQADTYFINPRNYHGTCSSSGSFQPIAYQAQTPSFNPPRQKYHMGSTTSSTRFQSTPLTNDNSNINHRNNNRPISTAFITTINQYHGAAAGRTTGFQNTPNMDTNHYHYNNTIPAGRMEEEEAQFPKMLDIYSSLPTISSSSFPKEEENPRAARAATTTTKAAAAAAAPAPSWEVILPTRSTPPPRRRRQ